MEYLGLFVIAAFLIFSGPIALIWCCVLSSRLHEVKADNERLEHLLKKQQEKERQAGIHSQTIASPPKPTPKTEPVTQSPPRRDVSTALQVAKEQAAEQLKSEEPPKQPLVDPPKAFKPAPPATTFDPTPPGDGQKLEPKPSITAMETKSEPLPPPLIATVAKPESAPPRHESTVPPPVLPPEKQALSQEPNAPRRHLNDAEWEQAHPSASPQRGDIAWQSVELWIGRKLLGWVAVAAFIISAALFIIHAVNEGWIGRIPPEFRVLAIATFGGAFLVVGKYFHRIGWRRFSTMLSSAGVIIVFQAGYASFAYFQLISIQTASVVMGLIVLGSFLLSWHYGSVLLGMVSIVGGLAVPMLLSTGTDRYPEFFTYLVILNLGTVMLVNLLRRPPIALIAFIGTQAEFWLWQSQYYVEPVALEKLTAVLLFQGAFYAVYLLDTTIAAMVPKTLLDFGAELKNLLDADPREKGDVAQTPRKPKFVRPTWDDVVRAVMSPIVLFGTTWWFLRDKPEFASWLGIMAFVGSAWYALLAVLYTRYLARTWSPRIDQSYSAYWKAAPAAATVLSLAFLAVGIPLHFQAEWLALGWITVFAGLWYFGHRQFNRTFMIMSVMFLAMGIARLLYDIFMPGFSPTSFGDKLGTLTKLPESGLYDWPSLAAILMTLTSAVLVDRLLKFRNREDERVRNLRLGLAGYGFLTLFLSVEAVRFFLFRPEFYAPAPHWASISLTVLWSVSAMTLLETGTAFRSKTLRITALAAMTTVTAKMLLFDFYSRLQFETPIHNPLCPALIGCSLLLIVAAVQARYSNRFEKPEKTAWGTLGIGGVFTLLGILSVECY